jgi:hypothetical protein
MTQQLITTTPSNSQQGDSPKAAFDKVNANFTELYGNGTVPATFGSVVVGTPTGGNEGPGSLNAASVFVNGVAVPVTQAAIGAILYPQTAAELAVPVNPTNFSYQPGDPRRYGTNVGTGGDDTAALAASFSVVQQTLIVQGLTFLTTGNLSPVAGSSLAGYGKIKLSGGTNPIIAATASNWAAIQVTLDASLCSSASKVGISIGGTTNDVGIQDCTLTQARILETGTATTNLFIRRNILNGACVGGISGASIDIGASAACTDWWVQDNVVNNSDGGGIQALNSSNRGIISGNSCRGNLGVGIWCESVLNCAVSTNQCINNQQTGIGWNNGSGPQNGANLPQRSSITGNICIGNTQDGIDINLQVGLGSGPSFCYITVANNVCISNGAGSPFGCGINATEVSLCTIGNNICFGNGLHGINVFGGYGVTLTGNQCIANGSVTANTYHGIALQGATNSTVMGNVCTNASGGSNQAYGIAEVGAADGNVISGNNCVGNVSGNVLMVGAHSILRDDVGGYLDQSFVLSITNTAGTLQHSITNQAGNIVLGNYSSRINNASPAATNTPTGTDATTAFAAGGKIGSASTNRFWFDTAAQVPAMADGVCSIDFNSTGNSFTVRPIVVSININGVTQNRLAFEFFTGGTAFALTAANVPASQTIQVQFKGKLN